MNRDAVIDFTLAVAIENDTERERIFKDLSESLGPNLTNQTLRKAAAIGDGVHTGNQWGINT